MGEKKKMPKTKCNTCGGLTLTLYVRRNEKEKRILTNTGEKRCLKCNPIKDRKKRRFHDD